MNFKRLFTAVAIVSSFLSSSYAQEKTYYVGIGAADVMDTYLSPYSYDGIGMSVAREVQYGHTLHNLELSLSSLESMAGNVNEYAGNIRYSIAHQFDLLQVDGLTVKAGPMGTMQAGGVYNERNGNNPGNAHVSLMADLSARVGYDLRLFNRTFPLQYTIAVPVLGIAYSPAFGQSYYEEFILGNADHNIKLAHISNTPSLRHRFTIAIPAGRRFIRIGYEGDYAQSVYNHLRYHNYTHNLVIGLQM